jgi:hypothetical protein
MLNRNQPSNIRLGWNCSKVKNTPAYLSQEFNNAGHFWTCRSSFVDNLVFWIVKTFTIVFSIRRHDTQHNDIKHDDSRHNDTQHNILQIATLGITNNNTQ